MDMNEPLADWLLVLIQDHYAWFVPPDELLSARGDDWDDAPHDCNAGPPRGQSCVVMFDQADCVCGASGSNFSMDEWGYLSVDDINIRHVAPWLCTWSPRIRPPAGKTTTTSTDYGDWRPDKTLPAGSNYTAFVNFVYGVGGRVYTAIDPERLEV